MKKSKKFVLVGLALLAAITMVLLPLAGCKTEVDPSTPQQEQPDGNTSGEGNNDNTSGENPGGSGKPQVATYTVTFNANGGEAVTSQKVESGKTASTPDVPELEGSWFLGWYSDSTLTKEFNFSAPVTADTTLYAKWSYRLHSKPTKLATYTGTASPTSTPAVADAVYVEFGDWPQTIKADDVTVDETKSKTMGGLTYYLGSDGNHYVKQEEKAYGANYTYSDGSPVGQGGTTTKWFKVEPIVWRVLTDSYNGKSLLLAEKILTGGIKWADSSNNYQNSNIRKWLNGNNGTAVASDYTGGSGFLQTAFTTSAQDRIASTTVNNSAASTNPASNPQQWNSGNNPYASDTPTTDKIFLLSEKEATTSDYGFAEYNQYGTGSTRIRVTTDYAKATGAYQSSTEGYGGWWWLRSPNYYFVDIARDIYNDGYAGSDNFVINTYGGVVPALSISLGGN